MATIQRDVLSSRDARSLPDAGGAGAVVWQNVAYSMIGNSDSGIWRQRGGEDKISDGGTSAAKSHQRKLKRA